MENIMNFGNIDFGFSTQKRPLRRFSHDGNSQNEPKLPSVLQNTSSIYQPHKDPHKKHVAPTKSNIMLATTHDNLEPLNLTLKDASLLD